MKPYQKLTRLVGFLQSVNGKKGKNPFSLNFRDFCEYKKPD